MNPSRWSLCLLTALMPVAIEVRSHGDSTLTVVTSDGTRIEVLGGIGEYAFITRGCEGQILNEAPVSFREVGGRVEQRLGNGPISVGVRGGAMRDDISEAQSPPWDPTLTPGAPGAGRVRIDNRYVNPYVTLGGSRASMGLGWVAHQEEFLTAGEGARNQLDHPLNDMSWHVRIGGERRYFAMRWMEGVPLYSSGGYLTIGLGGRVHESPLSLYGGLGAGGPFEGGGLAVQGSYRLQGGMTLEARTRLGYSGSRNASGVSLGVGYGNPGP